VLLRSEREDRTAWGWERRMRRKEIWERERGGKGQMEGEVERRGRTEGVGGPEELEIIPLLFEEVVEAFKQTIFNIQCLHNHPIHDKVTRDRESPPPDNIQFR